MEHATPVIRRLTNSSRTSGGLPVPYLRSLTCAWQAFDSRLRITHQLWEAGVRADFASPPNVMGGGGGGHAGADGGSGGGLEALQSYCESAGIPWMVIVKQRDLGGSGGGLCGAV